MNFDRFYSLYPRKVGRLDAENAWRQMTAKYDATAIIEGAKKFAAWCVSEGKEVRYIPHPATWLRGGRWMDGELQETIKPEAGECLMRKVRDLNELRAALVKQYGSIPPNLAPQMNRAKSLADVDEFLRNKLVPNLPANVTQMRKAGA